LNLALLHEVHGAIGALADQVDYLEATDELLLIGVCIHELAHLLKILLYLLQAFNWQALVNLFEQGQVALKVPVEIADINEITKYLRRKHALETLPVFLDREQEA
jgi:hypothetical protein